MRFYCISCCNSICTTCYISLSLSLFSCVICHTLSVLKRYVNGFCAISSWCILYFSCKITLHLVITSVIKLCQTVPTLSNNHTNKETAVYVWMWKPWLHVAMFKITHFLHNSYFNVQYINILHNTRSKWCVIKLSHMLATLCPDHTRLMSANCIVIVQESALVVHTISAATHQQQLTIREKHSFEINEKYDTMAGKKLR